MNEKYRDVAIIIPARIGSTRLANKPLCDIGGFKMIEHVIRSAKATLVPNIYLATDCVEIQYYAAKLGICSVTTRDCDSGTDRVYEALKVIGEDKFKYVINYQGDIPFLDKSILISVIDELCLGEYDIVTPVFLANKELSNTHNKVKVVTNARDEAMYFSRELIPHNHNEFLLHIGVYGFLSDSLRRFVSFPKSRYEVSESLEQLRALENGMKIKVCYSKNFPISVDTKSDLELAIDFFHKMNQN